MYNQQHREKHRTNIWFDITPNPRAGMFPSSRTITDWKVAHPKIILDQDAYPVISTLRRWSQWRPEYGAHMPRDTHKKPYSLGHYVPNGPRDKWTKGQYGVYKEEQAAWRAQRDQDRLEGLRHKLETSIDPAVPTYLQRSDPKCKRVQNIHHPDLYEKLPYSHRVSASNLLVSPFTEETSSEESEEAEGMEERPVLDTITEPGEGATQSPINDPDSEFAKSLLREGVQTLSTGEGLQADEGVDKGEFYTAIRFSSGLADSARSRRYHN
jgi:hypothetical protein